MSNEQGWQADKEHLEHYADEEATPLPGENSVCCECGKRGNAALIQTGGHDANGYPKWMHGHCAIAALSDLQAQLAEKGRECEEAKKALADNSELLTIAHMDGHHKGQKSAEAFRQRVMEWARGRCDLCGNASPGKGTEKCNCMCKWAICRKITPALFAPGYDNWTMPQAWEVKP